MLNNLYYNLVRDNLAENFKSGKEALSHMENSPAIYKGKPVPCLYMPKIFSQEAFEHLQKCVKTICDILDKVISRYLSDPKYRKLFPFEPELEELILTEAGYPRLLPIARLDIFLNEEDLSFKFCEFNADGSSAMIEDRELNLAIQSADAMTRLKSNHEVIIFELFDSWVREFAEIYSTYNKKVSNPRIAIVDFFDKAPNEFFAFQDAFIRAGFTTTVEEIRTLQYTNGELLTKNGHKIDAVYRRAVTRDVIDNLKDVQAFVQAAKDQTVCLIGHFRTQIIHNKSIFRILHQAETLSFLTKEEQDFVHAHIPHTYKLESGGFESLNILANKEKWIIKPEDLYGSRGVFAGVDCTQTQWDEAIKNNCNQGYLLQEYCNPYKSINLDFNDTDSPEFKKYNNITGMFVYNKKLAGLYSRASVMGVISGYTKGLTLASLVAKPLPL